MTPSLRRLLGGSILNIGIRGATLFFRFALSFYIVSYLGLTAAGLYGLAIGAVGLAPSLVGWGINYYVARQVVGLAMADAIALVRDRLVITLVSLTTLTCLALPLLSFMAPTVQGHGHVLLLILILVWLETIALDIYMPMIGLEMTVQANVMVFIRSALWIPLVAVPGLFDPAWRSLDMIFGAWIASHLAALAALPFFLRGHDAGRALARRFDGGWFADRLRRGWFIYVSDMSNVGLLYIDRYVVSFFLGLAATGIYSFYWSIANALQTLMMTAVVQVALPRLIKAFRTDDGPVWKLELRDQLAKTLGLAAILSLLIYLMTEAIIWFSPAGRFPVQHVLFPLLLLAAVARSCSDLLGVGITSVGSDRFYTFTNVAGVLLSVVSSALCLSLFGLLGAALAALATVAVQIGVRVAYLGRVAKAGA